MKYGLSDHTVAQICVVLAQYPQVDRALCATIAEALDDLLLPYTIDLSVFAELNHPELEAHIQRVGLVFFERDNRGF